MVYMFDRIVAVHFETLFVIFQSYYTYLRSSDNPFPCQTCI